MKETYLLGEPIVLPMFSSKAAHHSDKCQERPVKIKVISTK